MRDYNETISLLPLFAGIEPAELDGMLTCLNSCVRQYKKDQYILLNDEPVVNIGIVVRGSVETIREDLWGTRTPVAELRSGEIFGERYEVTRTPSSNIYFRAMTDSVILLMPFERAVHLCSMACVAHYKLVENLTSMISEKNRRLQEKIEVVSQKTLRGKILTYLSLTAQKKGSSEIEIPMNRTELAEYLCADRSALTRELSHMRRDKLLKYDKNTFILLDGQTFESQGRAAV